MWWTVLVIAAAGIVLPAAWIWFDVVRTADNYWRNDKRF